MQLAWGVDIFHYITLKNCQCHRKWGQLLLSWTRIGGNEWLGKHSQCWLILNQQVLVYLTSTLDHTAPWIYSGSGVVPTKLHMTMPTIVYIKPEKWIVCLVCEQKQPVSALQEPGNELSYANNNVPVIRRDNQVLAYRYQQYLGMKERIQFLLSTQSGSYQNVLYTMPVKNNKETSTKHRLGLWSTSNWTRTIWRQTEDVTELLLLLLLSNHWTYTWKSL